ncbi:carbon storage regulator [Thalassotalea sp. ND16A]|uniref:carbon storage regulator n=1 Tax=Thalassotalea sp. ND16A TaxID=1535422 RepID=UPI000519FECA|nr:carbon storage regulator [Thalassotalea sp. ND16A]KGJ98127.1 carbon storage regulator [Thalassotalea sp. ND16A]
MLILTRNVGDKIRIGNDIIISISSIQNKHVKIGVDAPGEVKVRREEIYWRIKNQLIETA